MAIGEANWGEIMGAKHLDRLRLIRDLIVAEGRYDAAGARLVCFSGAGFTDDLLAAHQAGDVLLVDAAGLYAA